MAPFAGIEVRSAGELASVFVFMAVSAMLKFQLENGIRPARNMTFFAGGAAVGALQGISGLRVIRNCKRRWLPTVHGVTS